MAHAQRIAQEEGPVKFLLEPEGTINVRPLTPVTDDRKKLDALTISELLLLRRGRAVLDCCGFVCSFLRQWRKVQLLAKSPWKCCRWNM